MARTIYLVDDSRTIRLMMRTILTHKGYGIKEFVNGEEALAACQVAMPDLILLDILLPGMDGYEVCRQLRAFSTVPIVMLTTRAEPAERARGAQAGASDYIVKPFDTDDLLQRVQDALSNPAPRLS